MSDETDQEEELVIVGEEGIADDPAAEEDQDQDQTPEDEDEDDSEDARLGADEEDDDEDPKEKRRRENRERRQRRQEARQRTQTELKFLRKRNADLERRFSQMENRVGQTETASIDAKIAQLEGQVQSANDIMAKAMEARKGDDFTEAQDIRDGLRDQIAQLNYYKQSLSQKRPETTSERPDPRVQRHAEQWMLDNEWWDPEGTDPDSQRVLAIDAALVKEGYRPETKAYWQELTNRTKKELPHQFEGDLDDGPSQSKKPAKKRGSGPKFRTGGRDRPLKKNEVYVSPERKQALIEAGAWDDPQLRQKYLRSYAKYDRENQSA